ncbi:DUF1097 domain-containing protein [Clostridium aestuarii]|uniref:DUF1097 domain-containing protein n=1 Tax=Clostridium aestuarii TaxID=338193 RepID=A0ABT4CZ99_9CLOT|nr:DUF1097 domain-containing protein [Clostridium aestuarii]MCY6484308.1 DUF1097 domain-containing protein [Clostridium aestuarii]
MKNLFALSLTTAILCGIWTGLSPSLGLLGWAGFAGCTAFFAAGGKLKGFKTAIITNLSGVFWAMVIIQICNHMEFAHVGAISTAVITFMMCIQAKIKLFEFIPGTFIGSFSTFASGGDWKAIIPALILGAILGYLCETSGAWLFNVINKNTDSEENVDM